MMHQPIRRERWHVLGCQCRDCEPHRPSRHRLSPADRWALQVIAGLGTGAVLAGLLDLTGAGPALARAIGVL